MPDFTQVENSVNYRYKDLGDGTFARVMALDGGITISQLTVSDVEISNDVGNAIPTEPLGLPSVARQIVVTATAQPVTLTSTVKRVSIKARNVDARYTVSGVANASTSHYIEAGERLDLRVTTGTTLSVIRDVLATSNGILEITELT